MPTARSMPRAAVFSRPSVTSRLRGLMSGCDASEGIGQVCLRVVRRPNHFGYPGGVSGTVAFMKTLIALVAALATALLVSSCTSPSSTSSDGHTDHTHGSEAGAAAPNNAADVTFVTGMIPHHEQAVEMSALVPQRSTNPEVIKLAADISAAQGPEIQTMKGFLQQWN